MEERHDWGLEVAEITVPPTPASQPQQQGPQRPQDCGPSGQTAQQGRQSGGALPPTLPLCLSLGSSAPLVRLPKSQHHFRIGSLLSDHRSSQHCPALYWDQRERGVCSLCVSGMGSKSAQESHSRCSLSCLHAGREAVIKQTDTQRSPHLYANQYSPAS